MPVRGGDRFDPKHNEYITLTTNTFKELQNEINYKTLTVLQLLIQYKQYSNANNKEFLKMKQKIKTLDTPCNPKYNKKNEEKLRDIDSFKAFRCKANVLYEDPYKDGKIYKYSEIL